MDGLIRRYLVGAGGGGGGGLWLQTPYRLALWGPLAILNTRGPEEAAVTSVGAELGAALSCGS